MNSDNRCLIKLIEFSLITLCHERKIICWRYLAPKGWFILLGGRVLTGLANPLLDSWSIPERGSGLGVDTLYFPRSVFYPFLSFLGCSWKGRPMRSFLLWLFVKGMLSWHFCSHKVVFRRLSRGWHSEVVLYILHIFLMFKSLLTYCLSDLPRQ